MATIGGLNNFGLFRNGDLREGNNVNFTFGTYVNNGGLNDGPYLQRVGGGGGAAFSNEFVEVDVNNTYQLIMYARTIQRGSNGALAGGLLGFSCYDSSFRFIDLRHCGGQGDTTLSRNLTAGDTHIYLTSNSGWVTGVDVTGTNAIFRHVLVFPSTHPEYSRPHAYTRIGFGDFNIYYKSMVQTLSGDWELKLSDVSGNDTVFPNIGYPTPSGTPISRGVAGGTYNYALGGPNYPEDWTRYSTAPFTGENRNSGTPFRFATKYIKFLVLMNFNQQAASPQDHVWGISKIFFGRTLSGVDYRNSL
jgi:hypothetical protein